MTSLLTIDAATGRIVLHPTFSEWWSSVTTRATLDSLVWRPIRGESTVVLVLTALLTDADSIFIEFAYSGRVRCGIIARSYGRPDEGEWLTEAVIDPAGRSEIEAELLLVTSALTYNDGLMPSSVRAMPHPYFLSMMQMQRSNLL